MNKVYFILGEDKKVTLLIRALDNAPFHFQSASYALLNRNETIANGPCEVDDRSLTCQIRPPTIGCYVLEITYLIANETFKDRIEVHVS